MIIIQPLTRTSWCSHSFPCVKRAISKISFSFSISALPSSIWAFCCFLPANLAFARKKLGQINIGEPVVQTWENRTFARNEDEEDMDTLHTRTMDAVESDTIKPNSSKQRLIFLPSIVLTFHSLLSETKFTILLFNIVLSRVSLWRIILHSAHFFLFFFLVECWTMLSLWREKDLLRECFPFWISSRIS